MLLGEKLKRALALLILISFVPSTILAQEANGQFSRVLNGERVKFDAWCFNDPAFAQIKARLDLADERCQLKIDKAREEQEAAYSLQIGNLETKIASLEKQHNNLMSIKDEQIVSLEAAALKRPNNYSTWYAVGGFIAGVLTVIGISLVTK